MHYTNSHFTFPLLTILLYFPLITIISANTELRALMDIKSSLDPQNKYLSSWKIDGDPCGGAFEGVACNEHRKVANISLQGKGLAGKLSPAVAELKCLSGLYLHYNSLSGEIPKEIANLTELGDLYLNVNNFSGSIPSEIGSMESIQVLQLCCNHFTGSIPPEIGFLKKLNVLALESNRLSGQIPASLGNLGMLKRLYLNFNQLSGPIPARLANIPELEVLDVQNNTLSGAVPSSLKRLNEGFHFANNPGLCGTNFSSLRACNSWDNLNVNQIETPIPITNTTSPKSVPQSATFPLPCNRTHCSKSSSNSPKIGLIVAGIAILTLIITGVILSTAFWYRRRKQKIGNISDTTSNDHIKSLPSPLVALEYSKGWEDCNEDGFKRGCKCNVEDVEIATRHFSEGNLLGKGKFSAVYKGVLKDGSVVAIKSISRTSLKSEEEGFMKGLRLLDSLEHENLVNLKGFCCSRERGQCFLIYDFAPKGNLSTYFEGEDDTRNTLDWATRISIIKGIAKGIKYLHRNEQNKPPIIHQNISLEKILLSQDFKPLILDSGVVKLLADDVIYSTLKVSAALGYMAPEYVTTGRFTEKSDIYAVGVIILQMLSGKKMLSSSIRLAAESSKWEDFIDSKVKGEFEEIEADRLTRIALECIGEIPDNRPSIERVIREMNETILS